MPSKVKRPLLPVHHSTGDWDFSGITWNLDTSTYISAPSSLRFRGHSLNYTCCLCKVAATLNIEEGMAVSWFRRPSVGESHVPGFCFRSQQSVGSGSWYNSYVLTISDQILWRRVDAAGGFTIIETIPTAVLPANTWVLFRISWWNGFNLQNEPSTILRVEYYDDGWQVLVDKWYDTACLGKGTGKNRSGLFAFCFSVGTRYVNFDDNELWST